MRSGNETNPCYIADVLATLHHGYLVPFAEAPKPFDEGKNYQSLDTAPVAVDKEWLKMSSNDVIFPASPVGEQPVCIAPLQAVVKESDVEDAQATLSERGFKGPWPSCEGADELGHIPWAEAQPTVDQLNAALTQAGSEVQVKARLCGDFSRTVNDYIIPLPFQYVPVDQLLGDLQTDGWLCKVDYRRCFLNIPLHPSMYKYMGLRAPDGTTWVIHRMLFGVTVGPHVASILTAETARCIKQAGVAIQVYLDDNSIAAPTREACYAARAVALEIMQDVGWPIAEDKLVEDAPAQRLAYRGVVFDLTTHTMSIPLPKLQATHRRVQELLDAAKAKEERSVRRIRSVAGRLGWISQVMPEGRLHLVRLQRSIPHGATNKWKVRLDKHEGARLDLRFWKRFLEKHMRQHRAESWAVFGPLQTAPRVRIFSDASGDIGFGGTAHGLVVAGTWSDLARDPATPSISVKELIPVYFLLREIAPSLPAGTVVIITTDNKSNAFSINKGTTCAASIEYLRLICQVAFQHKLRVVGDWIPREYNVLCDLLSRLSPLPGLLRPHRDFCDCPWHTGRSRERPCPERPIAI